MSETSRPDPRIAFFDHHAPTWDTNGLPVAETLRRLEELCPTLGLQPAMDVLEVGCGTGQVTAWLVEHVRRGRVVAVDFSPAMLAEARLRGIDAEFRCRDVCGDGPGPGRFDVVFCMHAFPHFRDQAAAVRNLAASLKPAGRFIVLHLDSWRNINHFHDHVGPPVAGDHLPEPEAWPDLLRAAGLQIAELIDRDDLFCLIAAR